MQRRHCRRPGRLSSCREHASITLRVACAISLRLVPLDRREIVQCLRDMLGAVSAAGFAAPSRLEFHLVTDAAISRANRRFLGCIGPTNILSFPGEGELAAALLFSADTFARECRLYGQPPADHFLRLLAHGMGHLAGLDHGEVMDTVCAACLRSARAVVRAGDML